MASKTKNIGGTEKDAFYRYKRPELKTKVEKPGTNGVKTVIENMSAIAKALKVPPEYPTRFLGYELCTQATYEDSTDRTCTIVKGKHSVAELDRALDEFIKKFILCPTCKLPETRISVKKAQVRIKCASCGHAGPLASSHRLENYISKNPPPKSKSEQPESDSVNKKGVSKKKETSKKRSGKETDSSEEEESKEKKERVSKESTEVSDSNESKEEKEIQTEEAEDWSLDTSIEAQKARRVEFLAAQASNSVKALKVTTGKTLSDSESLKPDAILKNFMQDTTDVISIAAELDRLELKFGFSPEERFRILLIAAIDASSLKTIVSQFTKNAALFKKILKDSSSQVLFISSIERLLDSIPSNSKEDAKTRPIARIGLVLQKLYEADVLHEDAVLTWAQSPPEASTWAVSRDVAVYARKCAKPFVEWLQIAEEEE